jgi:energy-coupling factor transporter ATP-binding protein EcfA2
MYGPEFSSRPVELHIVVRPGAEAAEPVVRTQRHYFSIVSDRDNFAAYDSATFFGYCFVSEKTVAGRRWFRFHFLETMVYMLLAQRYAMPVHAACVARSGVGVLLYGHSGAGKSTLAWACARAGWTYITDDGAWLLPEAEDGAVLGRSGQIRFKVDAPRLFPELEEYVSRVRPDGKVSLEVPTDAFPHIRTASRCRVGCVVVLAREPGAAARIERIAAGEVAGLLLGDMPRYGEEVRARYEAVVGRLLRAPCYRLIYDDLDGAVRVLGALTNC